MTVASVAEPCPEGPPADVAVGAELDAGLGEQVDAALDDALVELHVRHAVHQQPADPVVPLEHGDAVAGAVELVGGGEAGGPGADDRDGLARAVLGDGDPDPAVFIGAVDDRDLDRLDGHRRLVDAQHARVLARGGADAAGELGEVVGLGQAVIRLFPLAVVDQVVPLGDEVVDRAARVGLAERDAAVHAAGALLAEHVLVGGRVDLVKVRQPHVRGPRRERDPLVFHESGWLTQW